MPNLAGLAGIVRMVADLKQCGLTMVLGFDVL
jgi:hypothetical protein